MEALSSMRRDAEVALKCLLKSLVIRKKRDKLERALEAKERGRGNKGERTESDNGRVHHHVIITEQCP